MMNVIFLTSIIIASIVITFFVDWAIFQDEKDDEIAVWIDLLFITRKDGDVVNLFAVSAGNCV